MALGTLIRPRAATARGASTCCALPRSLLSAAPTLRHVDCPVPPPPHSLVHCPRLPVNGTASALGAIHTAQAFIRNTTAPFTTLLAPLPLMQSLSAFSRVAVGVVDRVDGFTAALQAVVGQQFQDAIIQVGTG
jgi:hypothetical protein